MSSLAEFDEAFAACPILAILRGVRPDEVVAIGDALVEAGIRIIEVPLNSPDPLVSIRALDDRFGRDVCVGAGTVLTASDVEAVAEAGGMLVVSPNVDVRVIGAAVAHGLVALPGFLTPTEAFTALGAGASALKLFPADAHPPAFLAALRAVLPRATRILPVGGATPSSMAEWTAAGAAGFGIGSAMFRPGMTPDAVGRAATAFRRALEKTE